MEAVQSTQVKATGSSKGILRDRNFILLWLGQGTSLIGDQFYLIALPWLVLLLTGDAVSLGLVLALAGIPRAIFMLAGGALTDRFSQRTVMIASDVARILLTAALAVIVLNGHVDMLTVYAFAIVFGTVSGIFMPASTSIVPRLVKKEQLQTGNAVIQGTAQLSVFIGPVLAGAIIAYFASQGTASTMEGVGLAFAFDAFTFLISVATLWLMSIKGEAVSGNSDILGSIKEGVVYVFKEPTLRIFFLIIAAINFLFVGPFLVGVPVIAKSLPEGAVAFGLLMSAYGGGNLLGIILSGALPKPKPGHLGYIMPVFIALFAIGIMVIGLVNSTLIGCIVLALLGIFNGYLSILLITTLQRMTPPAMMGRLMSLAMLSSVGLVPISQAITGFLINYSLQGLFIGVGTLTLLLAFVSLMSKEVRNVGAKI